MKLDNDKLKQIIFIIALFALGGFLFLQLEDFLSPFLGALVFYILLRRPFFYLTETRPKKLNSTLVAIGLMLASFLILVLPILLVSLMLSSKVTYLLHHYSDILTALQGLNQTAKDYIGSDLITADTMQKITMVAANIIPKFLSATFKAIIDIFVLYFLLYCMLVNARWLEAEAKSYLPFKEGNNRMLLRELNRQTFANSIGIGVLAIIQTGASTLGYSIFGVSEPFFWGVLTGIASAVPAVGTGLVWIPVAAIFYVSGNESHTYGLVMYCAIVLAIIENVFRFLVIKKLGDVHPLITFFGVIMGVELFGFVGIIFGPMLISYFILLLRIYRNEYLGVPHEH